MATFGYWEPDYKAIARRLKAKIDKLRAKGVQVIPESTLWYKLHAAARKA